LPYFIPVPFFLGTFGAFIQIRSPIPNRKALFDVGIAGPLAGLVATLPIFLWGLSLSDVIAASENTSMFNFDSLNPKATVLLAILSKIALGNQLTGDTALNLHPVAVAGFLGLVITALNLIPVGQLDGGHVVHAMFGQRTAIAIGQISRLLVLILAFLHQEFLWWAIFLLLMPIADEPALNDVTELDNGRDFLGLLALVILVMIVLPAPPTLIQWFYG
jgi:membrane-associated protease RseP (regulator of RpoE activity)